MRKTLENRESLKSEKERWAKEAEDFKIEFNQFSAYSENN
jgi:hypothetical protein